MKLKDITVGARYGALESPTGRYGTSLPREVEVLEIVEKQVRAHGGVWVRDTTPQYRTKRQIKVRAVTDKVVSGYGYGIDGVEKDGVLNIDARKLVAPWDELRDDVREKIDTRAEIARQRAQFETRVDALLGEDGPTHIGVAGYLDDAGQAMFNTRLDNDGLRKLIELAEKGASA